MSALMEAQKGSQRSATAARMEQKKTYKGMGKPAAIAAGVLILLFSFSSWLHEGQTKRGDVPVVSRVPAASTVVQTPKVQAVSPRQVTLQLKGGQTAKPVRVTGDQCILWWGADPDGHAFTTEARHEILPPWRSWEEWQKLRASGKVGNPGWLRFTATQGDTEVTYELRPDGQC